MEAHGVTCHEHVFITTVGTVSEFGVIDLTLKPGGAGIFKSSPIHFLVSFFIMIVERSPNFVVAIGQHVVAIFSLKTLQ